MADYISYNGKFYYQSDPIITAGNRGLRYGDGLFETLVTNGEDIQFRDWHFERLFAGLQVLAFELPAYFTPQWLAGQLIALCKKNQHAPARVRINIVRGNGGLYDSVNYLPNCIIESWPLPGKGFHLNENGLVTGIYMGARKAIDDFSPIKSNNYLPCSMAAIYAQKNKWNDAFILNTTGNICDATIANVFIVKNENIYTSPLSEGGIAGIMRKYLLQNLPLNGYTILEQPLTIANLLAAEEVFLTNVIKGIRWVAHCGDTTYTNRMTSGIYEKLLKK